MYILNYFFNVSQSEGPTIVLLETPARGIPLFVFTTFDKIFIKFQRSLIRLSRVVYFFVNKFF